MISLLGVIFFTDTVETYRILAIHGWFLISLAYLVSYLFETPEFWLVCNFTFSKKEFWPLFFDNFHEFVYSLNYLKLETNHNRKVENMRKNFEKINYLQEIAFIAVFFVFVVITFFTHVDLETILPIVLGISHLCICIKKCPFLTLNHVFSCSHGGRCNFPLFKKAQVNTAVFGVNV